MKARYISIAIILNTVVAVCLLVEGLTYIIFKSDYLIAVTLIIASLVLIMTVSDYIRYKKVLLDVYTKLGLSYLENNKLKKQLNLYEMKED